MGSPRSRACSGTDTRRGMGRGRCHPRRTRGGSGAAASRRRPHQTRASATRRGRAFELTPANPRRGTYCGVTPQAYNLETDLDTLLGEHYSKSWHKLDGILVRRALALPSSRHVPLDPPQSHAKSCVISRAVASLGPPRSEGALRGARENRERRSGGAQARSQADAAGRRPWSMSQPGARRIRRAAELSLPFGTFFRYLYSCLYPYERTRVYSRGNKRAAAGPAADM